MSLRNLFRKQSSPKIVHDSVRLNSLVLTVARYIATVLTRDPSAEFRPATLAQVLHESELAILAAFYVLEKQGIAQPHYGLYCTANATPIEVYSSPDEVPTEAPCDVCDVEHSTDDRSMYSELFFTIDADKLSHLHAAAA